MSTHVSASDWGAQQRPSHPRALAAAYEIANQYVLHEPAIRKSLVEAIARVIERHLAAGE